MNHYESKGEYMDPNVTWTLDALRVHLERLRQQKEELARAIQTAGEEERQVMKEIEDTKHRIKAMLGLDD
jgi:chaperonin cofactor prefoldin